MKTLKRIKVSAILLSCVFIALGVCILIWPGISAVTLCWLVGILAIVFGAMQLVRYCTAGPLGAIFRHDLALGVFGILAGVLLVLHPMGVLSIMPIVIGFYIVIDSVLGLQASIDLARTGHTGWWLALVAAILSAVCGVLLILSPFEGAAALMVVLGISLIFDGVQNLVTVLYLARAARAAAPVEVDYTAL